VTSKTFLLFCLVSVCLLRIDALAHDPALRDASDANAEIALPANYVLTFTLTSEKGKQQADLITAQRGVTFDFVDDPEHSFRFKGQLKPGEANQITLAYSAILITMVTTPTNAKQAATTSGEGAVILEFNKPITILKSARQQLAVSIRPATPAASPAGGATAAQP